MLGKVGFPPPLVADVPHRLQIIYHQAGLLVLDKPAGIVSCRNAWEPTSPNIESALRLQLDGAKPELERLQIRHGRVLFPLEPYLSGCLPVISDPGKVDLWTNLWGSNLFGLTFTLVVKKNDLADDLVCQLPIAYHSKTRLSLISHKTGKKSETRFRRLARYGSSEVWEACATYLRRDQIRLHASEVGLSLYGEDTYLAAVEQPLPGPSLLSLQTRRRSRPEKNPQPLYPFPHLHLREISIPQTSDQPAQNCQAPLPGPLQQVIDRLKANAASLPSRTHP
ncbi:MAG: hypothetical protein ACFCU4_05470 [Puniceicoccaceae bacterium]